MAFGILPFGSVAPWGGPGSISLIAVLPIGTNEIVAFFTSAPRCTDPLGYRDSRNPLYWSITPVDPVTIGIDGEEILEPGAIRPRQPYPWIGRCFRDPEDSTQVHLVTVPQLQPGLEYDVTAGPILGQACEELSGVVTSRFRAVGYPTAQASRFAAVDTYRDIANPFFVTDASGRPIPGRGVWSYDETGEIVLDDAAASLKKRALRRITTILGGFSHLPRYGLPPQLGTLARPADLQALALRLQEQLRQEPDVRDASVSVSAVNGSTGTVVIFEVVVQQRQLGEISFRVQAPVLA